MTCSHPTRRTRTALFFVVITLFWLPTHGATGARADDGPGPESPSEDEPARYQGSYWALQAKVGFAYRLNAGKGELPGPAVGASVRVATFLSLLDVELGVLASTYEAIAPEGAGRLRVQRLSLGGEAHLHPLLTTILKNSTLWYILAGIYGSIGIDLDLTFEPNADGPSVDFGWHVGGGLDIPLGDPNGGWGLWLGVNYRLRFLDASTSISDLTEFDEHVVLLTLGYRNNDLNFFRAPRPPELDYREPSVPFE
jgi:hypothetical protein